MDNFVSILLFGISFGAILFLLGAGLSLTMGLMRIVNLTHGALYMVGAYVGLAAAKSSGNFVVGLAAGATCTAIIGLFMEWVFLRRLYQREQSQVLLTIGFIYIITNLTQWIWGAKPLSGVTPALLSGNVPIGHITFPVFRLAIIIFGLIMAVLLWLFQEKTRIGAIIRAGMDNREITSALGINLRFIFTGIFALGAFVAGLCGLMGAPLMGINLQIGWDALMLAMIVVIVGGTGSIQGAFFGGLIIGLLDAFGKAYFPDFAYFAIYAALILILLFKPSGLMGRMMSVQMTAEQFQGGRKSGQRRPLARNVMRGKAFRNSRQRRVKEFAPHLGLAVLLLVLPVFLSSYYLGMLTKVLIFAIFAASLDLIMGYTGLFSLGHAAFLGVAGYAVGILSVRMGVNLFWLIFPAAIFLSVFAAGMIGYFSLRVSGVYFLLVTLAFGQLLSIVATKWFKLTGGSDGLVGIMSPNLCISGLSIGSYGFYYMVFIAFGICFLLLYRIVNSSFGSTLVGIRENEMRMRSLGYNTWALKYVAIILSGAFAGVAGIFYAYFYGAMVPRTLAIEMSTAVMLMVIIGGPGTLFGPFVGAVVVVLAEHFTRIYIAERWPLILGGIFVACVMIIPDGFANYLSRLWRIPGPQRE